MNVVSVRMIYIIPFNRTSCLLLDAGKVPPRPLTQFPDSTTAGVVSHSFIQVALFMERAKVMKLTNDHPRYKREKKISEIDSRERKPGYRMEAMFDPEPNDMPNL